MTPDRQLRDGIRQLGLTIPADGTARLHEYLKLLGKWNRVYNLTAVRDENAMITRHLLDSLSAARFVAGPAVADVGSGAGFPGIPLAIALPEVRMTLVESRRKPTQFLLRACAHLELENVRVCAVRAESLVPAVKFDTVLARAVAALPKLAAMTAHVCKMDGRIVALKGRNPVSEIRACAGTAFAYCSVSRVVVPGLAETRHIVVLTRHRDIQADTRPCDAY